MKIGTNCCERFKEIKERHLKNEITKEDIDDLIYLVDILEKSNINRSHYEESLRKEINILKRKVYN